MIEKITIDGALVCYLLAVLFYLLYGFLNKKLRLPMSCIFLILGLVLHTTTIVIRWVSTGNPPFATIYETMIFFSWSVLIVSLFAGLLKVSGILTAILPLVILGCAYFIGPSQSVQLPPILNHPLFPIHVATCLLGYGAFGISFVLSIIYLYLVRRAGTSPAPTSPDQEIFKDEIDNLSYQTVAFGVLSLGAGILLGAIWAKDAWGRYWSWDPKETWALITWLVYGIYLVMRMVFKWHGKKTAWVSISGFLVLIFAWFGVNYLLKGLHSYG